MKAARITLMSWFCAVLVLTGLDLIASDLFGIYAVVEKVVFEPTEILPQRIQIWGAFAIVNSSWTLTPVRGYLYFTLPPQVFGCTSCPPASQATENARKEWADLKAVAGTGQGVGIGGRFFNGRVRSESERPEGPDPYPVFMGLAKLGNESNHPSIVDRLKEALKAR